MKQNREHGKGKNLPLKLVVVFLVMALTIPLMFSSVVSTNVTVTTDAVLNNINITAEEADPEEEGIDCSDTMRLKLYSVALKGIAFGFVGLGAPLAGKQLLHYLDNTGDPRQIDSKYFEESQSVENAKKDIYSRLKSKLKELGDNEIKRCNEKKSFKIPLKPNDRIMPRSDENNLCWGAGKFDLESIHSGKIIKKCNGNQCYYEIIDGVSKWTTWDTYDFRNLKDYDPGVADFPDVMARVLEVCGRAKRFPWQASWRTDINIGKIPTDKPCGCTPCTKRKYYEDGGTKEILEEIENMCNCICLYHYYTYNCTCLVTEHCNDEGEWEEISVGDPEIKGDWISHRMEVEPCDIDMLYELESTGLAYLPDPGVPENCEVTGVSVDLIPFYIDEYDSDWYWIDCAKERDLYYWEDGIVEASGNLRCYCENTEQWENKGSYTWYGDYFIEIWETFMLIFQCPDLSSALQSLSDAPVEEPLSIMNTNNKCFTSQTDGRNGESPSRNIDIDISSRIFPSEIATHDIVIDSTVSRVLFMVYWAETGSDLYLTLNTPGGIIDPSMASTDPSIDYKENAFYRYYMIHYPEPGNWTMNINAVSVPVDGLDYNVIMNLVSEIPLSLSISTNKDRYNPNEQAIITANLKYNNTPLIGASVVTRILRPDGTEDKLLLFDNGSHDDIQANDGNYSTTYTNTTIKGTYDIIISASGTTPDGDFFNREKSMPIIVATLTAKFSNTYSDYGTDTDGDGLYDYMTIDVGVNVAVAGNYSLAGLLSDADGNNIASAINRTYLDIEDKTLKLIFDGKKIHKHGVDGPYSLKRLTLLSESSEIVDSIFDAYATKSYKYTEFQTKLAEFTGNYSDYGTDTDGDGLYDFLTIDVGINVTTAGDYNINGGLYDANGNDIVWAINSTYLDVGNQTVQLNFDGKAIQKHGVEGPYYLKHLGIYDKNRKQIDGVFDVYTTSAYNPTDFEAPLAVLTSDYADYGIDFDGDGLYDYLTIDVGVNVSAAGNYSLMGYLYDVNGTEIVWSIDYGNLDVGNHIMHLDFNGKTIQMHGVNGPYYLKHLKLSGENWTFIDYILDAYNTSAYNDTDFVDPVSTENEVTISGVGLGELRLIVSYKDTIPVFAGRYSYDLVGINVPQRPNNFTITTSEVKNLKLGLKKIQDNTTRIWVTQTFAAPEGKVTAQSDLPSPGNYHVKIFGDAADGASEVDLELTAVKKIKASGDFSLSIDISGFPAGKYTITAKALNGCFTDLTLDGLPLAP